MSDRIIEIAIVSPSDVKEERHSLLNILPTKFKKEKYEDLCKTRILTRGWEEIASQPGYTQDIINQNLIQKVDIVLAIFKHKLGTPILNIQTGENRSPSGTAEELIFAIERNKEGKKPLAMAYYYEKPPESLDENVMNEWENLKLFKQQIRNEILYGTYIDSESLLRIICNDVCQNIQQHSILNERIQAPIKLSKLYHYFNNILKLMRDKSILVT